MDCCDYMLTEWARVPMMPTNVLFRRSWDNIVSRATKRYSAEAVAMACQNDAKLRDLVDGFQKQEPK